MAVGCTCEGAGVDECPRSGEIVPMRGPVQGRSAIRGLRGSVGTSTEEGPDSGEVVRSSGFKQVQSGVGGEGRRERYNCGNAWNQGSPVSAHV